MSVEQYDGINVVESSEENMIVRYLEDANTEVVKELVSRMAEKGYGSEFAGFRQLRFDEEIEDTANIRF